MPTYEGQKRADPAPTHVDGLRVAWLLAICAIVIIAAAGWLAANAASALGQVTTTSTRTTTGAVSTATGASTTTTAASTTPSATTTSNMTTTQPGTVTTAAATTTATTATPTTATPTTATPTTATPTTATPTGTSTVSRTTTAPSTTTTTGTSTARTATPEVTGSAPERASEEPATTVTVTVTTPAPTTTTTTSTASTAVPAAGETTDAALGDAVSTTLGDDSGALVTQSELAEALDSKRPPAKLVPIYKAAASVYDVPWQVLAAINAVESDYGTDEQTSSAGAIGWMQFEPTTFARYEIPNGTGRAPSPYNAIDAIFAAAHLLSANGASTNLRQAIYSYNHAAWYVNEVTFVASEIVGAETHTSTSAKSQITAMTTTAKLLSGTPYVWGGGHSGWSTTDGYDCSGFVSAVLHAAGYLSEPQTTQTLPSVTGIVSGPGRYVTLFDRTDASGITGDHVIIDIDGQWWEAGGGASDGGADDVHEIPDVSASYLATFNRELHPKGL